MATEATYFQQGLLDELPAGFTLLGGLVEPAMQTRMVELARDLCRHAPLIQPRTRFGTNFNLKITSWGKVGWLSDEQGYRYEAVHPRTKQPWPPIPADVRAIMLKASSAAGYPDFDLQTVLVNFYNRNAGKLGLHQDKTEQNLRAPIVTISLGDSCIFGIGGLNYSDPVQEIVLDSGDVLVQGGPARMFFHEVMRLLPGSSKLLKQGGRISLTGRTYV
jgi:alkylated DNA repair protein (DNA oxidative demethylase)